MTRILLFVLMFCLNFGVSISFAADLVVTTHEAQRLRIPADQPLPPSGQRLVIPVRSGMTVLLQDKILAEAEQQIPARQQAPLSHISLYSLQVKN